MDIISKLEKLKEHIEEKEYRQDNFYQVLSFGAVYCLILASIHMIRHPFEITKMGSRMFIAIIAILFWRQNVRLDYIESKLEALEDD